MCKAQSETGSLTENQDCHPSRPDHCKDEFTESGVSSLPPSSQTTKKSLSAPQLCQSLGHEPPEPRRTTTGLHGRHQTTEPRREELHVQHGSSREATHEARVPHVGQHEELPELRDVGTELRSHGTTAATRRRCPRPLRAPGGRIVGTTRTTQAPERSKTGKDKTSDWKQRRDRTADTNTVYTRHRGRNTKPSWIRLWDS